MKASVTLPKPIRRGTIASDIFNVQFANEDTKEAFVTLFKEMGSPRAFFAELIMAQALKSEFKRINQSKGFDLLSVTNERPWEVKAASKSGVDLKPSGGKGKGRTPETERFFDNCEIGDYAIVDGIHFQETGNIRYVVLSGNDLWKARIHKLTAKQVAELFAGHG